MTLGGELRSVRKIAVGRPNTDHLWFVKGNKSARVDRVCASGWTIVAEALARLCIHNLARAFVVCTHCLEVGEVQNKNTPKPHWIATQTPA